MNALLTIAILTGVGDPQVRTGHPWYPGELACSSFERLFATQDAVYERVTGRPVATDEDRALASWHWRNTHFWHGTEGAQNLWGEGFERGHDLATRDYWTGLFAHGFGLCGTTHAQWSAELNSRLGHTRSRVAGVPGHNSMEVFLTGNGDGDGRWALLDHDLSTVIFARDRSRLLGVQDILADYRQWTDRKFEPDKQRGWLVCGLHPNDGAVFSNFKTAEYLAGYAGPPPMVQLRRGETLRRYLQPGLDDGKTFVFWGRNDREGDIPGPSRSLTWVNQPEKMFGSTTGTTYRAGQARCGNAVYTYTPDFRSGDYREGVVAETDEAVDFEFQTPYIIAATPPNDEPFAIYQPGGRNGLRLFGDAKCAVSVSVDRGQTWSDAVRFRDGLDFTDVVKGFRQYWLRLAGPKSARPAWNVKIVTVCQANPAVMPRLTDGENRITVAASGQGIVSAGPTRAQAQAHVVEGAFDAPRVTLSLKTPRGEIPRALFAAAHVASSNPPNPEFKYQIEFSTDDGRSWQPVVQDWRIVRRGDEPGDFWSQSFCYGSVELPNGIAGDRPVRIRFRNDGGKRYLRAEAHLLYNSSRTDDVQLQFGWTETDSVPRTAEHTFSANQLRDGADWTFNAGHKIQTRWAEWRVDAKR